MSDNRPVAGLPSLCNRSNLKGIVNRWEGRVGMRDDFENAGAPLLRLVHPSDFSKPSRVAFAHALKISLDSKAQQEIVPVQAPQLAPSSMDVC